MIQYFDEKGSFEPKYSLRVNMSYFGYFKGTFYPFYFCLRDSESYWHAMWHPYGIHMTFNNFINKKGIFDLIV